jgi:hypothetical protein
MSGKIRERPLMRVEYNSTYLPVASNGGVPTHLELDALARFERTPPAINDYDWLLSPEVVPSTTRVRTRATSRARSVKPL